MFEESFEKYLETVNDITDRRISAIDLEYFSDIDKYYGSPIITESVSDSIIRSIKKFFANLITEIQRWVNSINIAVERRGREMGYHKNLVNIEKKLLTAKKLGRTEKVTISNHEYILREYKKRYKELAKYGKKFSKMKYNSTNEIDTDIEEFNKLLKRVDKEMEKIENTTMTVSIDEALTIVQKELSGNSRYIDTINDLKSDIQELESESLILQKNTEKFGNAVIPKHLNFIRCTANDISKFSRKWIGRFVGKFVFTFANII